MVIISTRGWRGGGVPMRLYDPRDYMPAGDPSSHELGGGVRLFGNVKDSQTFLFYFRI